MEGVPEERIRVANRRAVDASGRYVLYWMIANRRGGWNFSLQQAAAWARELGKPLLVFEPLRSGYPWASDRFHYFLVQGMAENARQLRGKAALYVPYLEPQPGDGRGLLAALASRACVVVSDDFPCFFLPRMVRAAAEQTPVRLELIDSNGLLPLRAAGRTFSRAVDFRRFLQRHLPPHLARFPKADPLAGLRLPALPGLPPQIRRRWPSADPEQLARSPSRLAEFPINHGVAIVGTPGGAAAAAKTLRQFLAHKLPRYDEARNQPEEDATSGLSPYLHFGHISAHQVFSETMDREGWCPRQLSSTASGSARGWWGTSPDAESFLDELITWREMGYNLCAYRDDYDQYASLPEWAKKTLADHRRDPRAYVYSLEALEAAETHDELWNAAQRQLVREGRIHNYLRMLWGKKILEWSPDPQAALEAMIELNNKYALDGRDPNSYSGIFWCLGRYDRPWGPERSIFGKVRYMSSENTARKVQVREYLARYRA